MASRLALSLILLAATWLAIVVESGPVIMRDENDLDGGDEDEIDLSHLGLSIYGEPDESVGERVAEYNPETDLVNPEELGTYVGGDILVPRPGGRNGLADKSTRWPGGVVPFVISGNFRKCAIDCLNGFWNTYVTYNSAVLPKKRRGIIFPFDCIVFGYFLCALRTGTQFTRTFYSAVLIFMLSVIAF